jgi:REP element-mobilizing transposase RayT
MTRLARIIFENAFYHVISRGNNQENIFLEDKDFKRFLATLKFVSSKYDYLLYGYVLMPNHFHLLLETKKDPISKIMSSLLTSYTMYFNKKCQRIGHLFQNRFKSLICDKESYFLEVSRYIHLNPVKAGLVKKPADYKWSSYRTYVDKSNDELIDKDLIYGLVGSKESYRNFVLDGLARIGGLTYPEVKRDQFVGDSKFVRRMEKLFLRDLDRSNNKFKDRP